MSVNKVILIGNVGRDPEVKYFEKDRAVANVTLATSERVAGANGETTELTEWHRLVFWGAQAQYVEKYVRKGSKLFVEGGLRTRTWDDKNGIKRYTTEIWVDKLEILASPAAQQQ